MSFNFKPDKALQDRASEKLRKLLLKKSFMERWEPVQKETRWVITGRPNVRNHKKLLPEYCYNIVELHRRTIYKTFTPLAEVISYKNKKRALKSKTVDEARKAMTIEWAKMGKVLSAGERGLMYFENELELELKRGGLLKPKKKKEAEIHQLMFGDRWIKKKIAEIQAQDPSKPWPEIIEKNLKSLEETTKKAIPEWHQKARDWEPGAVKKFHAGITQGSEGFIKNDGKLKGEEKLKLKDTYEFLLIVWPEINEMLKAKPPKTRNDLWEWLKTFSYARWIEIEELEQLNRLCNEIKLKLKKPGAPQKVK